MNIFPNGCCVLDPIGSFGVTTVHSKIPLSLFSSTMVFYSTLFVYLLLL